MGLLSTLSVFVVLSLLPLTVYAQQPSNTTEPQNESIEFLGVQHAQSGSVSQINTTSYTLQLNNVSDNTMLFSDRPDRIVESISTSDFVGNWTTGQDSFQMNPPNAVLVYEDMQTGNLNVVIIELFNPEYNETVNELTYNFALTDNALIDQKELGQSVLIIDATPGDYVW